MRKCFSFLGVLLICLYAITTLNSGCAQIGAPVGGPKDTLAPVLVRANPPQNTTNFKGNRISLNFDEYLDVQDIQNNLLVSPVQKNNPRILNNLKNVTIIFKDSLLPNTTYAVNFGNAIKDVNEGNILKNFSYVFSTGKVIDSLSFSGNVFLAETGKADSTMIAMLYRNADDSSVQKIKPNYIARVKSDGSFTFKNLPAETFRLYALKDGDGGKTYNSKTEMFAFSDSDVVVSSNTPSQTLYASALEKEKKSATTSTVVKKPITPKIVSFTTNLEQKKQSLLDSLKLTFLNPLKIFDTQKIILSDTNYHAIANTKFLLDSIAKTATIYTPWQPEADYILLIPKDAVEDSIGNMLVKNDTLRFAAKAIENYGRLVLRFSNLDLSKHPVLQFIQQDEIKSSFPITAMEWSDKLFPPGDYEIRILYDINQNGKWDHGDYSKKLQPEKV
ncbi:MAG: Ig-like domain-containing domain, partial [Ferruginibacter sp.]